MELLGNNRVWIIFLDSISFLWAFLFLHGLYEPSKISSDLKKTLVLAVGVCQTLLLKLSIQFPLHSECFFKFFREPK